MTSPDYDPYARPNYAAQTPAPGYAQPPAAPQQSAASVGQAQGAYPAHVGLPPTNGSATASFILSLFGLIPLVSIIAIILGRHAQATVRRTGEGGYGMAKAGTVIGYVGAAGWLLVVVFAVAAMAGGLASG